MTLYIQHKSGDPAATQNILFQGSFHTKDRSVITTFLHMQVIEVKMKRLARTPASLPPPDPKVILCSLPWLSGLEGEVLDAIMSYAQLVQFEHGDLIISQGEEAKGIYIIVSGLVKV